MTQKPVILVFPFELLSHYTRSLEICKILKEHFRVKIQNSDAYGSFIKEADIETFNCPHFNSKEILNLSINFDFSWLNLANLENIFKSQSDAILEHKSTLVIGDNSPTLKMAAEKCHVPYVSIINGYMTRHYAVRKKIPDVHYAKKYQKKMPDFIFNFFQDIAEKHSYRKIHKAFSIIRRKNKLSSKNSYLEELEGDLNLICDIPELFPQKTLPSNFIFIGSVFYKSQKTENKIIEKILANGKKKLLVTNGSSGDLPFISLLLNPIFADYNIIVASPDMTLPESEFIISEKFINNYALLEYIDVILCHCGNGTIYQGLSFGIPILCATTIFEQEWNLQRIEDLKLGENISHIKDVYKLYKKIKKWDDKKNSEPFEIIKNSINLYQNQLYEKEDYLLRRLKKISNNNGKY